MDKVVSYLRELNLTRLWKRASTPKKKYDWSWRREAQKTEESDSPWLGPDPTTNTKARCKWCNVLLVAGISMIKTHKQAKKHKKNAAAYECSSSKVLQIF